VSKTIIKTIHAPAAVGPYSQAWFSTAGFHMWASSVGSRDGAIVGSDAATQADRALRNIEAILRAAALVLSGSRATVYLTNMDELCSGQQRLCPLFPSAFPTRVCVEVSRLPLGALVEIDAIAKVT